MRVIVGGDGGAWDMLGYVGICFVWGEIESHAWIGSGTSP